MKTQFKLSIIQSVYYCQYYQYFWYPAKQGCYLQQLYLIENKTDKELMVYFEYGFFTYEYRNKKTCNLS